MDGLFFHDAKRLSNSDLATARLTKTSSHDSSTPLAGSATNTASNCSCSTKPTTVLTPQSTQKPTSKPTTDPTPPQSTEKPSNIKFSVSACDNFFDFLEYSDFDLTHNPTNNPAEQPAPKPNPGPTETLTSQPINKLPEKPNPHPTNKPTTDSTSQSTEKPTNTKFSASARDNIDILEQSDFDDPTHNPMNTPADLTHNPAAADSGQAALHLRSTCTLRRPRTRRGTRTLAHRHIRGQQWHQNYTQSPTTYPTHPPCVELKQFAVLQCFEDESTSLCETPISRATTHIQLLRDCSRLLF